MRLNREKSYGDLERGHSQCWVVSDRSLSRLELMTESLKPYVVMVADYCGETDSGYSSEFIVDVNYVAEFKSVYKSIKMGN